MLSGCKKESLFSVMQRHYNDLHMWTRLSIQVHTLRQRGVEIGNRFLSIDLPAVAAPGPHQTDAPQQKSHILSLL
jgi:hypothetical protein